MVDPNGRICYVSQLANGNRHDATAWNSAPAFPPHVWCEDGTLPRRTDGKTLIDQLEEKYGLPGTRALVHEGKLYQPCISGDKAYPKIALPSKWSLFVTMTAESEPTQVSNDIPNDDEGLLEDSLDSDSDLGDFGDGSSMEEFVAAQPTVDELADISREGGDADLIVPDIPNRKEVYMIDNDPARFRSPEIAKFRSVVERSIGAMKKFRLLLNVAFLASNIDF
jgi:hypothetical protein